MRKMYMQSERSATDVADQISDGAFPCPGMAPAPPAGGGGGGGGTLPPRFESDPCLASAALPGIGGGEIGDPIAAIDETGDGTARFGLNTDALPMGAAADPSITEPRGMAGLPMGEADTDDDADVVSEAGRFKRGSFVSNITAGLGVLG